MIRKFLKWEPVIYKRGNIKEISSHNDYIEFIFNEYFTNELIQENNINDIYIISLKDDGSLVFSSEKAKLNNSNELCIKIPYNKFDQITHNDEILSLCVKTSNNKFNLKVDDNFSLPVIYNPSSDNYFELIRTASNFLKMKKVNSSSSVSINNIDFQENRLHLNLTMFFPRIYKEVLNNQDEYYIQSELISKKNSIINKIFINELQLNPNYTTSCSLDIELPEIEVPNILIFSLKRINCDESHQLTIIPNKSALINNREHLVNNKVISYSTQLKNDYEFLIKSYKKTFEPRVFSIEKVSKDSFNLIIKLEGELRKGNLDHIKNLKVLFKERDTKAVLSFDASYNPNKQTVETIIDTNSVLMNKSFSPGVWDGYLIIEDTGHLITNPRVHGITEYSSYNYPQIIITNGFDHYSLKLYYNYAGNLSLFIRDYMIFKNLNSIIFKENKLFIKGHINIMKPNTDVFSEYKGNIKIPIPYSQSLLINASIYLNKTNKNDIEFSFLIISDNISREMMDKIKTSKSFNNWIANFSNSNLNFQFPIIIDKEIEFQTKEQTKIGKIIEKFLEKGNILKVYFYKLISKIFPIKKNTFIFQSFYGNHYSDNPRAIFEKLYEIEGNKNTYIWILKDKQLFTGKDSIIVKPKSWKFYYYMARSQFFINNANFPDFFNKRKGQFFLQTWHGTPLKKLGLDVSENAKAFSANTDKNLLNRVKKWDFLISPNPYTSEIMKRAYQLDIPIKVTGYPRNDQLVNPDREKIKNIRKYFNIPDNKKIILYAPTWREDDDKRENYRLKFNIQKFYKELSEEYVILLRLHYFDAKRLQLKNYSDFIFNATYYNDIGDLYNLCDILVTDYSSVMFDFAITDKPILFYTYDYTKYKNKLRGFYLDFKSLAPGPLLNNSDELLSAIKNIDSITKRYYDKYSKFKSTFNSYEDGNASQRSIEILFRFREGGKVE